MAHLRLVPAAPDPPAAMPGLFTYDELLSWFYFLERDATPDEVRTALARLCPADGPAFLADLHSDGLLTAEAASIAVSLAWERLESPARSA